MYILMRRANTKESWIPMITYKELSGAQHAIVTLSRSNEFEWDIFVAESITKRLHREEDVVAPKIVKERGYESGLYCATQGVKKLARRFSNRIGKLFQ